MNYSLIKVKTTLKESLKDSTKLTSGNDFLWGIFAEGLSFRAPFSPRYAFMHLKTARNIKPYHEIWLARYLHNYDVYNI